MIGIPDQLLFLIFELPGRLSSVEQNNTSYNHNHTNCWTYHQAVVSSTPGQVAIKWLLLGQVIICGQVNHLGY